MEEILNQSSVEITRDRLKKLLISKIDLDYGYGQMKLSKETNRLCVIALTGRKVSGCLKFEKGFYGLAKIPTIFQRKIDLTLDNSQPALLDDVIVVIEHERKLFDLLVKMEDARY